MPHNLIYLLEDDGDILQLLKMLLSAGGYQVKGFTTISAFKEEISCILPDLFIMDINLPDGNGLDISHELSTSISTAAVPILLMSANAHYEEQYLQVGAKHFIAKPFKVADFMATVKKII